MKMWSPILLLVFLAAPLAAQPVAPPTFSIDNVSPAGIVVPATGADILAPVPPAPGLGVLPAPGVVIAGAGPGGLLLMAPVGGQTEVDALSYGQDPNPLEGETWYFSVDRTAVGILNVPAPSVTSEGAKALIGAKEASADVFASAVSGPIVPPVNPPVPFGNNTGFYDGDGIASASGALYTGLGLNGEMADSLWGVGSSRAIS